MKRLLLAIAMLAAAACHRAEDQKTAERLTNGSPDGGRKAIERYGCGACHTVPGVNGANGMVGPPLTGIANRMYLAGQVPNTPENMMLWIRFPQQVEQGTSMPNLNVGEQDARDIAAYLYTLRQ